MAHSTAMRDILSQVAAGTLSPEEAAARLEEIERESSGAESETEPGTSQGARTGGAEPESEAVRAIRIVRQRGQVEVVGDPSVKEAVADGPHIARREGDTLIIEGEDNWEEMPRRPGFPHGKRRSWDSWDDIPGFVFSRRFSAHGGWPGRWGMSGWGWDARPLVVRMNPNLPLEITLQAGSSRIRGVTAPIRAEVRSGSTSIYGFAGPLDLSVQAGSVRASGRLDQGDSHIVCEAGSVQLQLTRDSNVRITAHSTIGRISLPTGEGWVLGRSDREATIGSGEAKLDIEATAGAVTVTADQ